MVSDGEQDRPALEQIERAASPMSLTLLQQGGWFRASQIAKQTSTDRAVVRKTARALAAVGLLDEREVIGAPKQTFEWHVNPIGERLARLIEEWLGLSRKPSKSPPRYLGLFAVTSHEPLGGDLTEELVARLQRSDVAQIVPAVVYEERS
jgi:hypothetical protein